jgi:V8-like Glu-specific endopeptidase
MPSEETNILTYPYSCIGLLKYSNTSRGVSLNGTAFLIDSDLILTNADNIYSKQD